MKRNEIRALADEAYAILDESNCEIAIERALEILQHAEDDPESYLLLSELSEESNRYDQALLWIDRGLARLPQHEGLILKKASLLIDGFEDIDEAFELLLSIKKRFKDKNLATIKKEIGPLLLLDIYLLLIDCFRLKSDFNEALSHAKLAKEIAPFDEKALLALATAYFEMGEYDEAEKLLQPIEKRNDASDFYWLHAHIVCAKGQFKEADNVFMQAYRLDRGRYHRPIRINDAYFASSFEQALLALPREIRELVQSTAVDICEVVPLEMVKNSSGCLSPTSCIIVAKSPKQQSKLIYIFKKNIENLASKKEEIKDLIASALLHELDKLLALG